MFLAAHRWSVEEPHSCRHHACTRPRGISRSQSAGQPSLSHCPRVCDAVCSADMTEATRILSAIEQGDPHAAEQLLPLVYEELRRLAARKLAQEIPGHALQTTSLVHEAYLRLVDVEKAQHWDSRGHFFAAAAEPSRRIVIDNARRKKRLKRGGSRKRLDLKSADLATLAPPEELLIIDESLSKLTAEDPKAGQLVKLHYFAGLS